MSLVFVAPELLESAAADLENIRSSLTAAHAAAAIPTTGIAAAGADDVSAAVAALFGEFGEEYQALSAQDVLGIINAPTEFLFGAPIISAPPLQILQQYALALINAPTETFLGRPLIGTGITPNHLTTLRLIVGLASAAALAKAPMASSLPYISAVSICR